MYLACISQVGDGSEYASLDFPELQEALARCAIDMFDECMHTWLPSHSRYVFTMAEALRAFLRVLLWEASVEQVCMHLTPYGSPMYLLRVLLWEASVEQVMWEGSLVVY